MSPTGEFKQSIGHDSVTFTYSTAPESTPEERLKRQLDRIEENQKEIKAAIFILSVIAGLAYAAMICL